MNKLIVICITALLIAFMHYATEIAKKDMELETLNALIEGNAARNGTHKPDSIHL